MALQIGLINKRQFNRIVMTEGLDFPIGDKAEVENWRKAILNNIIMFGDGKTPGQVGAQIQKKFLEQRKIFLWGAVTDETAKDLCEKLLYLESADPGKEIIFYLNSPGGSITAGMAVYDTMKLISSPVTIVVTDRAGNVSTGSNCATLTVTTTVAIVNGDFEAGSLNCFSDAGTTEISTTAPPSERMSGKR